MISTATPTVLCTVMKTVQPTVLQPCSGGGGALFVNWSWYEGTGPAFTGEFSTPILLEGDFIIAFKRVYDSGQNFNGLIGEAPSNVSIGESTTTGSIWIGFAGDDHEYPNAVPAGIATGDEYDIVYSRTGDTANLLVGGVPQASNVIGTSSQYIHMILGAGEGPDPAAGAIYDLQVQTDGGIKTYNYALIDTADNSKTSIINTGNTGAGFDGTWSDHNWVDIAPIPQGLGRYHFDGTDYATLNTPWAANGRPREYEINFNADRIATGLEQYIFSGIEDGIRLDMFLQAGTGRLQLQYRSATWTQANEVILNPLIEAGKDYKIEIRKLGDDAVILINGVPGTPYLTIPGAGLQPPITTIGMREDGTRNFAGRIWSGRLTDDSVIQGREYRQGSASTSDFGQLNTPVPLTGAFDISIPFIYTEHASADFVAIFGSTAGDYELLVYKKDATQAGRVVLFLEGGSLVFDNVMNTASVQYGQSITMRITRSDAGVGSIYIDGVYIRDASGTTTANSTIDLIGKRLLNANYNGMMANLAITTNPVAPTDGFPTYGDRDSAGYIEHFPLTQNVAGPTGYGSMVTTDVSSTMVWNSNGLKQLAAGETRILWPMEWVNDPDRDLYSSGFTLQFEVEKGFFDESFTAGGTNQPLFMAAAGPINNFGRSAQTANLVAGEAKVELTSGVKTVSDYPDPYVTVHISFEGLGGNYHVFVNKMLIATYPITSTADSSDLYINGGGALLGFFPECHTYYVRNAQINIGPITFDAAKTKTLCTLGDSNCQFTGQYQIGNADGSDPDNVAPLVGYVGDEGGIPSFKQLTLAGWIHTVYGDKGYNIGNASTPDGVKGYGRGGAAILSWPNTGLVDNNLERRMDTALGGPLATAPTPILDDGCDIWHFMIGSNDALYSDIDGTPIDEPLLDSTYKAGLDRAIDEGKAETIYMISNSPLRRGITGNDVPSAISDIVFNMISSYDGYRGKCVLVDVYTGWDIDTMAAGDGLHYTTGGITYAAQQLAAVVPSLQDTGEQTYTFPLERLATDDTAIICNENANYNGSWMGTVDWVDVPLNSRYYKMDEGSGLILYDTESMTTGRFTSENNGNGSVGASKIAPAYGQITNLQTLASIVAFRLLAADNYGEKINRQDSVFLSIVDCPLVPVELVWHEANSWYQQGGNVDALVDDYIAWLDGAGLGLATTYRLYDADTVATLTSDAGWERI